MISLQILAATKLDIISFFPQENAVHFNQALWFKVLCASLKMKHSVLILSEKIDFPQWDENQRIQSGDNWCWLAPRALSLILATYPDGPSSYLEFKKFLISSK